MRDPFESFESATLPNGLTLYAHQIRGCPWQMMGVLVMSGSHHDQDGTEGTAHFMEHLVSENGGSSARAIEDFFESHGGRAELGCTSYEKTTYRFHAPAEEAAFRKSLELFGNMLLYARIERHLERERQVVMGEFHDYYPAEFRYEYELRGLKAVYGESPLSRTTSPLGSLESIEAITETDLQRYYDVNYVPQNMSVVAVGGFSMYELQRFISASSFAREKRGARATQPAAGVIMLPLAETELEVSSGELLPGVSTGEFVSRAKLSRKIPREHAMLYARCLNKVLFEEIREKRAWTYGIQADIHPFPEFYDFGVGAKGLDPSAFGEIFTVVSGCIEKAASEPDLFQHAKEFLVNATRMSDWNGWGLTDLAMSMLSTDGRLVTDTELIERVNSVKLSDIEPFAELLSPDMRWSMLLRP